MDTITNCSTSSTKNVITLQTVYELASDIGEHFKKLIDRYGEDSNQDLIPTVVKVLEYLEDVVIQREDDQSLIEKLEQQIDQLQQGQRERNQRELKYLSEIEDIDESWRKENIQLSKYVNYLKNENMKLSTSLKEKTFHSLNESIFYPPILLEISAVENAYAQTFQHTYLNDNSEINQRDDHYQPTTFYTVDKLKQKIEALNKDLEIKADDIDQLRKRNKKLLEENLSFQNIITQIGENISYDTCSHNNCIRKESEFEELKQKIKLHEKELEIYRLKLAKMKQPSFESSHSDRNNNSQIELAEEAIIRMEDLPVQGPLPKEPDEKRFFKVSNRKSQIWSFFPRLTRALIK
ncbi:hypothetical protein RDWZM_007193 [Blomia tropicalis]|uniref:RH1 domain-containing protein n=1 Tax=Blomia tropicalis TaxID=40697 RepID=A0A9Q0RPZ5_BLOTA|nr:hypothetical protein RDWZM_007193 [Blomia tropicalis]